MMDRRIEDGEIDTVEQKQHLGGKVSVLVETTSLK